MAFRFESLEIWHMARDYARKTYEVTAKFPRHEDYGLRSQMNRAANSISLNIAEGSAKDSNRAFNYQLEIAIGSLHLKWLPRLSSPVIVDTSRSESKQTCMTMDRDWQRASMLFGIPCSSDALWMSRNVESGLVRSW